MCKIVNYFFIADLLLAGGGQIVLGRGCGKRQWGGGKKGGGRGVGLGGWGKGGKEGWNLY